MGQNSASLAEIITGMKSIQGAICRDLESLDGQGKFHADTWQRSDGHGGGGESRIIEKGSLIEKGGVNFSHIHGPMSTRIAEGLKLDAGIYFHATGVSIVLHAFSPHVPIIHMNVRYFETESGLHWFGGGIDVTPIYIVPEQAVRFHQRMKALCDRHEGQSYESYKAWADRYFYLKHRNETRGIGGIFFDDLIGDDDGKKASNWSFVQDVAANFVPAYQDMVEANRNMPFGEKELNWQALRRSRYVEFNLLWDRGTRFGLDSDGRTESILMSMPPMAKWAYNHQPEPASPEAATLALLKPMDWLGAEYQQLSDGQILNRTT